MISNLPGYLHIKDYNKTMHKQIHMMEVIVIMLIKCRECGLQVSNLAVFCPHCGCPVPNGEEKAGKKKKIKKGNARRRLSNGFGQISEIKNRNLRNPYRVMVSVGKADNGRPICRLLKPRVILLHIMKRMQHWWITTGIHTTWSWVLQPKNYIMSGQMCTFGH